MICLVGLPVVTFALVAGTVNKDGGNKCLDKRLSITLDKLKSVFIFMAISSSKCVISRPPRFKDILSRILSFPRYVFDYKISD